MKLLIIFCIIVLACAVVGGLIAGFVYGIVKRGRQLDKANTLLREINQQANLWKSDEGPFAEGVRQRLDKHYNGRDI
jgi:hypothetical protein